MNDQFYDETTANVERDGRTIIGVFPCEGDDGFPFAYTIGNAINLTNPNRYQLPELLVIGTANAGFLNVLSQMMIDADAPFEDGAIVLMPGARLPVKVIAANGAARTEYAIQAGEYFGRDDYPIMQVLMPDRSGRFPDEAGCAAPFSALPVLRSS
jgi:hypothetical protein